MPESFQCAADDPVKWKHVQGLMADIKAVAKELAYQTYTSPVDKSDSVWMETDTPDELDLSLHFAIGPGHTISGVRIVEGFKTNTPWKPEPYMDQLIKDRSLLAILKDDDCICTLMWLIQKSDSGYTFEATSELPTGCCPTLKVPKVGDRVAGNPFIPSAALGVTGKDVNGWRDVPACRKGGSAAIFYSAGRATSVQRAFRIKITWAIRKKQFDEIYDEWLKLIALSPSIRGKQAKPVFAFTYAVTGLHICGSIIGPFPAPAAGCVLAKILQSWKNSELEDLDIEGLEFTPGWGSKPGCIALEQPTGLSRLKKPWEVVTCGSKNCDGRPRVYCNTLAWLNGMSKMMRTMLCPSKDKPIDWDKDFVISQYYTKCPRATFNLNKSSSGITISVDLEPYGTCGGPVGCLGVIVSVGIFPLCGRYRFSVAASGDASNIAGAGPDCDDTRRATVVTVTSAGKVFRAGVDLDKCIEDPEDPEEVEAAICSSTGSINANADTATETDVVSFSSGLIVEISLDGLQALSATVTLEVIDL